jgi:hypothetical protein
MKKTAFIIISAIMLAACGGPKEPKKLLSREQMENIMYDLSMLQAIRSFAPQKLTDNNIEPHSYIFKKYKIDSLTLAQNQMFYAQDIETFKIIQKNVAERLKADRAKIDVKKAGPKTDAPAPSAVPQDAVEKASALPRPKVLTEAEKAAVRRKRDSVRAVAQKRLKNAPITRIKQ